MIVATGPTGPAGSAGTIAPAAAVDTLPATATLAEVINQFNALIQSLRNAGFLSQG